MLQGRRLLLLLQRRLLSLLLRRLLLLLLLLLLLPLQPLPLEPLELFLLHRRDYFWRNWPHLCQHCHVLSLPLLGIWVR